MPSDSLEVTQPSAMSYGCLTEPLSAQYEYQGEQNGAPKYNHSHTVGRPGQGDQICLFRDTKQVLALALLSITSITYQRWRVTYAGLGKQFSHLYNPDQGAAVPATGWVFVAEQVSQHYSVTLVSITYCLVHPHHGGGEERGAELGQAVPRPDPHHRPHHLQGGGPAAGADGGGGGGAA